MTNGKAYSPFHEVMMLVEGDAAARLGELAHGFVQPQRHWRYERPPASHASDHFPVVVDVVRG
jgi:endonuclease/exonuclease/phosphatase family metal-dependent hydrolase